MPLKLAIYRVIEIDLYVGIGHRQIQVTVPIEIAPIYGKGGHERDGPQCIRDDEIAPAALTLLIVVNVRPTLKGIRDRQVQVTVQVIVTPVQIVGDVFQIIFQDGPHREGIGRSDHLLSTVVIQDLQLAGEHAND